MKTHAAEPRSREFYFANLDTPGQAAPLAHPRALEPHKR
jgi:hypothetical protein